MKDHPKYLKQGGVIQIANSQIAFLSTDAFLAACTQDINTVITEVFQVITLPYSPVEKAQKRAIGRSRVCPNFYCSLLFTGMCTLILWIITCHPNISRNCNKSLDILDFYLLTPFRRTIKKTIQFKNAILKIALQARLI